MSTPAEEFVENLTAARDDFVTERPIVGCTVRFHLADGDSFYVKGVEAGPGPHYLTIDPYPEDNNALVRHPVTDLPMTPTRILVALAMLRKVTLVTEAPEARALGFTG